jgi:hypothetical protein
VKIKINLICIFLYIFLNGNVFALSMHITNDNIDMINSKKICMRVNFDQSEKALYKDALCISIDSPFIELRGWHTAAQIPAYYVSTFKKNKKLFVESFNLDLLIDFDSSDVQKQINALHMATLSISSLILTKNETTKAENVIIPLNESNIQNIFALTPTTTHLRSFFITKSTLFPCQNSFVLFNHTKHHMNKQNIDEILIINRMKEIWLLMRQHITMWFSSFSFYKWYIALWILVLLLLLRLVTPSFWFFVPLPLSLVRELCLLSGVFLIMLSWYLVRTNIHLYKWYGGMGIICLLCACYYLWPKQNTMINRLKILFGTIFAVAIVPLLTLALIHRYFYILRQILK